MACNARKAKRNDGASLEHVLPCYTTPLNDRETGVIRLRPGIAFDLRFRQLTRCALVKQLFRHGLKCRHRLKFRHFQLDREIK